MAVGLGWLGVGVGAVGFVLAVLLAQGSARGDEARTEGDTRRAWLSAGLTAVLTVIFWAVSRKTQAPFSEGQTLGWGFLIGGLLGAEACLVPRLAGAALRGRYLLTHAAAFLGLFGASLTYTIFHGDPTNALIGFAIGAAMAAIVKFYPAKIATGNDDLAILTWAALSITLAASIVIAVSHFDAISLRLWWPLPILMATTACVAAFIATEICSVGSLGARPGMSVTIAALIGGALTVGLSVIYAWRLLQDWALLETVVVGVGVIAAAAWLIASSVQKKGSTWGLDAASACVLLVVAFVVVEFKLWSGLGIGVGLIAAWSVALPVLAFRSEDSQDALPRALTNVLYLGLSVLLLRVFLEVYDPSMSRTDLQVHYSFIGALFGAIAPFVLVSSMHRLKDSAAAGEGIGADLCALAGAAAVGFLAAAMPIAAYMIWELKVVVGLQYGLIAASAFMLLAELFHQGVVVERRGPSLSDYTTAPLVIGSQLVAIQFIRPLIDVETTRATQVWTLSIVAVVAVVWFVVTGVSSSRGAR